jgi:hypothetical protein
MDDENLWPPPEDLNICLHFDDETKELIKALTLALQSNGKLSIVLEPGTPKENQNG